MKELKPCPFCGGKAQFHNCAELENEAMAAKIIGKVGIHCCTCHVATLPYESHEEAAEAWNRRIGIPNLLFGFPVDYLVKIAMLLQQDGYDTKGVRDDA